MNEYVADTHALYWHLTGDARLGTHAQAAFEQAASGNAKIWVSSIVLAELFYLLDKQGAPSSSANCLKDSNKPSNSPSLILSQKTPSNSAIFLPYPKCTTASLRLPRRSSLRYVSPKMKESSPVV